MRWILASLMILTLLAGGAASVGDAQADPVRARHPQFAQAGAPPSPQSSQMKTEVHVRVVQGQQSQAREAYKRGEIQSLSIIRRSVTTTYKGRIISTQFVEQPKARVRYVYMFRVLGKDGEVVVIHVNAKNSNVITVKGPR
jgi:hypothetical protein